MDSESENPEATKPPFSPWLIFAITACLVSADIISDLRAHVALSHIALELSVAAISVFGLVYYLRLALRERREREELQRKLSAARTEGAHWRAEADNWRKEAREALVGLSDAIDRQFSRWELTQAEREVALLLLKGLSHKDIAALRGTSERTVRQQSLTVYRKAEVAGRAELSAFFLEDLLTTPPSQSSSSEDSTPNV